MGATDARGTMRDTRIRHIFCYCCAMSETRLLIPVYLNQRIVFDLVAMLQGGISTVTRISETNMERANTDRQVGAAFGLTNAFATLLKIDLSANRKQSNSEEGARTSQEERIHTPASLFFELRTLLLEKGLLTEKLDEVRHMDFVEFSASLHRNPVIEVVDAMREMMQLATIFAPQAQESQTPKHKNSHPQKGLATTNPMEQIEQFGQTLRSGDTIDLTTNILESHHRAVLTVETQYLNDPSMGDLVDGTFTVVGKVIRVLKEGEGSVSLIRKTPLARLPAAVRQQAFSGLNALSKVQGFELPEVVFEIPGPALHVMPIAIYA